MEQAIKKSIEGGWKPRFLSKFHLQHFQLRQVNDTSFTFGLPKDNGAWTKSREYREIVQMEVVFLDPLFWQSLGKAMGWNKNYIDQYGEVVDCETEQECLDLMSQVDRHVWLYEWHRFIDALAEGKDAESFFNELLK